MKSGVSLFAEPLATISLQPVFVHTMLNIIISSQLSVCVLVEKGTLGKDKIVGWFGKIVGLNRINLKSESQHLFPRHLIKCKVHLFFMGLRNI